MMTKNKIFNSKIDRAIMYAALAHKDQMRKTNDGLPYISHPVSVGFILQSAGFDEDTIIAGILHDTIEDTGKSASEIEDVFGKRVRKIVEGVSENKSLAWEERKESYAEKVFVGDNSIKAVSAADKIQNISSLISAVKEGREEIWSRFKKDKLTTVNHYFEFAEALKEKWNHPLALELFGLAQELQNLIK